jgi:hypothetical protein
MQVQKRGNSHGLILCAQRWSLSPAVTGDGNRRSIKQFAFALRPSTNLNERFGGV